MLNWVDSQYGTSKSARAGLFHITVYYDGMMRASDKNSPPYKWRVNEHTSKHSFATMEEAEQSALRFVRRKLQETISAMEGV